MKRLRGILLVAVLVCAGCEAVPEPWDWSLEPGGSWEGGVAGSAPVPSAGSWQHASPWVFWRSIQAPPGSRLQLRGKALRDASVRLLLRRVDGSTRTLWSGDFLWGEPIGRIQDLGEAGFQGELGIEVQEGPVRWDLIVLTRPVGQGR